MSSDGARSGINVANPNGGSGTKKSLKSFVNSSRMTGSRITRDETVTKASVIVELHGQ